MFLEGASSKSDLSIDAPVNILHLNAQSVRNKLPEIEIFLNEDLPGLDVFCVSEHFLTTDTAGYCQLEGFDTVSCFARDQMDRGGSMVCARKGIPCVAVPEVTEASIEGICEAAGVYMKQDGLLVVSLYRPPKGDFDTFWRLWKLSSR